MTKKELETVEKLLEGNQAYCFSKKRDSNDNEILKIYDVTRVIICPRHRHIEEIYVDFHFKGEYENVFGYGDFVEQYSINEIDETWSFDKSILVNNMKQKQIKDLKEQINQINEKLKELEEEK